MKRILTILLLIAVVVVVLIRGLDQTPLPDALPYEEALVMTAPDRMVLMGPGSEYESEALARFKALWSDFTEKNISENLAGVYAPDIWFNDTVKTITNQVALEHYMAETANRVASCKIEFLQFIHAEGSYFSRWKMTILPDANKPEETWVSYGISHLRFNESGRVILHQDYWDSAGGLYEHLPVVGWIIRNIRARL